MKKAAVLSILVVVWLLAVEVIAEAQQRLGINTQGELNEKRSSGVGDIFFVSA